jgi:hypothetical protein
MNTRSEADWRAYREMGEELRSICVEAVRKCTDFSPKVREQSEAVGSVEIHSFDQSYIQFLEEQIELEARGPEWTELLKRRKVNLENYADRELARCRLFMGEYDYSIDVDPISRTVIHWEDY